MIKPHIDPELFGIFQEFLETHPTCPMMTPRKIMLTSILFAILPLTSR